MSGNSGSGSHDANWKPPPKDHPGLKRMESITIQSYKPKIISETRRMIEDLCRDLIVNNDHIHVVEQRLRVAINEGLSKANHGEATVKCFPTYVNELPTGNETGRFLALDLGGTNFRVLLVEIGDQQKFNMESKIFAIPKKIMTGTGNELFDHIADCISKFIAENGLHDEVLPLGFTFSFPCRQEGLATGILTNWTKGFNCSGVEGEDVVALLKEAIDRHPSPVKIDVCAILNDTTGCLMSCAWKETKCRIGLIIGTGTNACYLEEIKDIETVDLDEQEGHMIINTEWGAFGDKKELDFIRTKWDEAVDAGSLNPGKQTFEKMISGMYMGELTRQVLVDMVLEGLMFSNINVEPLLQKQGSFPTRFLSEIESDPVVSKFSRCRSVFHELFGPDQRVSDEDCSATRMICELVSRRAGFMAAAGIAALLKKMDYHDVVVAIDGSVFRYHPHFPNIMRSRISQLMGVDYKFDLMLSTDGSGRGAALVAAVLASHKE
eukprot:07400.XXX_253757_251816_1 [CDS] Oithona nana genome sequencing.